MIRNKLNGNILKMVNCHMLVEFDRIREFTSVELKVQTLKDIKNDLIGSVDVKQAYFD